MATVIEVHPTHPQRRLIAEAIHLLGDSGVIAYPTESGYALGCKIGDKKAMETIRQIRQLTPKHNFTLICRDLAEISTFAKVNNSNFRFLKAHTPGAYTFILPATKDVPKRLQHPKRNTIGIRVTEHPIARMLIDELNHPLMSVTFWLPDAQYPIAECADIPNNVANRIDVIIDSGNCGIESTSIIDLTDEVPEIVRIGKGDVADFS